MLYPVATAPGSDFIGRLLDLARIFLRQGPLVADPDFGGIANQAVRFYRNGAGACGQIIGQSESDLREREIGNGADILRRHVEALIAGIYAMGLPFCGSNSGPTS